MVLAQGRPQLRQHAREVLGLDREHYHVAAPSGLDVGCCGEDLVTLPEIAPPLLHNLPDGNVLPAYYSAGQDPSDNGLGHSAAAYEGQLHNPRHLGNECSFTSIIHRYIAIKRAHGPTG